MQKELQQLEKKYSIDWREYRISDIFEVKKGKRLPERVLEDTKGNIALINQSTQNNMVARYSGLQGKNEIYSGNAVTFGVNTKSFGYQTGQFYTIADVLFLKADFLNSRSANFFIPIISKALPLDGWDKIFGLAQMKDLRIKLPTKNNKIAFDYIEEFLATLNTERLATLDAYLIKTNLKNYKLTKEEKEALEDFDKVEWGEFKIGELFDIGTGSLVEIKKADFGNIPRISVQTTDNGVLGYYDEPLENARYFENFVSVNFFGKSFYHPYKASVEMKVHTLKIDKHDYTRFEGLFISSVLEKRFEGVYSYGNQLSSSKLKNDGFKIQLPITPDHTPDFDFMAIYIKAMQKIVIKKVVDWTDKRIAKTKEVVEKKQKNI